VLQIYNHLQKDYELIYWQYQDELKIEKENLPGYLIKILWTWLYCNSMEWTVAAALMFIVLPNYLKWCNETFQTCSSLSFEAGACRGVGWALGTSIPGIQTMKLKCC